ncbi:uncharacterized protein BDZ83DRAFT_646489 [Colletotrichum acutatum]|uniref:Uncharacterized protein n=1 Tax=Glomerella acutata TaxID=27357 RepID=A0AAD8XPC8_GLOAC|nr:uncharacterized protein BDZ83DRAFT_646489 [Colletotrichum acutatum]KAK1731056.1 hypothetical protein BDZ83DRAFT_646489 [Colletotrichum acutatum]
MYSYSALGVATLASKPLSRKTRSPKRVSGWGSPKGAVAGREGEVSRSTSGKEEVPDSFEEKNSIKMRKCSVPLQVPYLIPMKQHHLEKNGREKSARQHDRRLDCTTCCFLADEPDFQRQPEGSQKQSTGCKVSTIFIITTRGLRHCKPQASHASSPRSSLCTYPYLSAFIILSQFHVRPTSGKVPYSTLPGLPSVSASLLSP